MKRNALLLSLLLLTGCSGMNNTQGGALGGGLLGAGLGAIVGGPRHALAGAAVGGALGAGTGALIGKSEDNHERRRNEAYAAAASAQAARQMSLNDVIQMAQSGQSDAVIIGQINTTNSVFQLTAADVNELHQQRVSDQVINYMQSRRYVVVQPRPVVVYERTYIPSPPPPPPPEFGVGVMIRR